MLILIRSLLVFFFSFVAVSSIQAQDLDCVCKEIKRNGEEIILGCVCKPKDNPNPRDQADPNPRDQADSNINKGVVAAWTFDDGRVSDAIGRNHGKLFAGAVVKNGGRFGKALDVNGNKECRADIKVSKDIEKVLEKAFTVSYWLYVRQAGNHSGVWKGEKVGWGPNFTFRMVPTTNTDFTWGVTTEGSEDWFETDGVIAPSKWIHVCQTVDGKQATAYVTHEGKKTSIPPSSRGNPHAASAPYNLFEDRPIELGAGRQIGGVRGKDTFLDGMIDELIIWNRALAEDEVKSLGKGKRPRLARSVKTNGKLSTVWGQVKSYNTMR